MCESGPFHERRSSPPDQPLSPSLRPSPYLRWPPTKHTASPRHTREQENRSLGPLPGPHTFVTREWRIVRGWWSSLDCWSHKSHRWLLGAHLEHLVLTSVGLRYSNWALWLHRPAMAFKNGLSERLDELRFPSPRSPPSESALPGYNPLSPGHSNLNSAFPRASGDVRANLQRRFTTDSSKFSSSWNYLSQGPGQSQDPLDLLSSVSTSICFLVIRALLPLSCLLVPSYEIERDHPGTLQEPLSCKAGDSCAIGLEMGRTPVNVLLQ